MKFPTFGEWLHTGNQKTPPGIYEKPPDIIATTMPCPVAVCELANKTIVTTAQDTVPLPTVQVVALTINIEVSSFACLLANSLKDNCHASSSLSPLSNDTDSNRYVPILKDVICPIVIGPTLNCITHGPNSSSYSSPISSAQPLPVSEPTPGFEPLVTQVIEAQSNFSQYSYVPPT